MPTVVSKVQLAINNAQPVTDEMKANWLNGLVNKATYLYQQLRAKITGPAKYEEMIGDSSNRKYTPMIDPSFVSKSERSKTDIVTMQGANLKNSYNKWDTKLALSFETVDGVEAKHFKNQVNNSADTWSEQMGKKTLRMTGDKVRGRGPAAIAGYWLTGEPDASGMLREGADVIISGGPVNVARAGLRTALRSGLTHKLTQAGILITESGFDSVVITALNTQINDFINGLQNAAYVAFQPTVDPLKSYCLFIWEAPIFRLEIQVVTP